MPPIADSRDDDVAQALNLLLHDFRARLSVAQGYVRLLVEHRIDDDQGRQRALAQSLEALGHLSTLCAEAGEFLNAATPERSHYPVEHLVVALAEEARVKELSFVLPGSETTGQLVTLGPSRAAAAVATIAGATARQRPAGKSELFATVTPSELIVTCATSEARDRLLSALPRRAFSPWAVGSGMAVPLAVRRLRESGASVWTLVDEPGAVAIAFPLELSP